MTFLLAGLLALVPLVIAPGLLFYYDVTPKIALFFIGTAALLPLIGWRRLAERRAGRLLLALIALQTLSLFVSTALSSRPELSLAGTSWRRFGLAVQIGMLLFTAALASYLTARPERAWPILRTSVIAGVIVALYGILQYFGWDPWINPAGYHIGEGVWGIVRPPGTLGYVSYFANYLVFIVFAAIALRLGDASRWSRLGAPAAALASVAIVLSGTRAAMLAVTAGAAVLALWYRPRVGRRALMAAAVVVVAGLFFYLSPAGEKLRSRVHWAQEDPAGGARLWLWRDSIRFGFAHWLVGTGPETFSSEFPPFQSVALARQFPDFYHESAHNIFLDAFTAQGVFGALILAGFCVLGFTAAVQSRRVDRAAGALCAGLAALIVTHEFTVFVLPTALCFYAMIAILVARAQGERPSPVVARPLWAALPVSFLLVFLAWRLAAGDRALFATRAALDAGRAREAVGHYAAARQRGLSADLWYSRAMAMAAKRAQDPAGTIYAWQQAVEAGRRAVTTAEDRHNACYSLASLYAAQNDLVNTERYLRQAIDASPDWFKPHWTLAQVLLLTKNYEEARREAARAVELNGGKNTEVSKTLEQANAALSQK